MWTVYSYRSVKTIYKNKQFIEWSNGPELELFFILLRFQKDMNYTCWLKIVRGLKEQIRKQKRKYDGNVEKRRIRVMEKSPRKHLTVSTSDKTRVVQASSWRFKPKKIKDKTRYFVSFTVLKEEEEARVTHSLYGGLRRQH